MLNFNKKIIFKNFKNLIFTKYIHLKSTNNFFLICFEKRLMFLKKNISIFFKTYIGNDLLFLYNYTIINLNQIITKKNFASRMGKGKGKFSFFFKKLMTGNYFLRFIFFGKIFFFSQYFKKNTIFFKFFILPMRFLFFFKKVI